MWHEHSSTEHGIQALTDDIAARIRACLRDSGFCTLALSGGRSPIPVFERLALADLDWPKVHIELVDERYVPPEHPDSNEGLVRRHLLSGHAAHAHFLGLYRRGASVAQAVDAANDEFRPIDLAILGMGDDGHTASLFPGARQLDDALSPRAAHYLHVTPPDAPHERITLSLAALRACRQRILHIAGEHKREVLRAAEQKIDKRLPVSYLIADPGVSLDVHWHP